MKALRDMIAFAAAGTATLAIPIGAHQFVDEIVFGADTDAPDVSDALKARDLEDLQGAVIDLQIANHYEDGSRQSLQESYDAAIQSGMSRQEAEVITRQAKNQLNRAEITVRAMENNFEDMYYSNRTLAEYDLQRIAVTFNMTAGERIVDEDHARGLRECQAEEGVQDPYEAMTTRDIIDVKSCVRGRESDPLSPGFFGFMTFVIFGGGALVGGVPMRTHKTVKNVLTRPPRPRKQKKSMPKN